VGADRRSDVGDPPALGRALTPSSPALLALDAVTVRLGGRPVLSDISVAVAPGEIVGVTGPNGAGKTTLLRLAANLLRPAAGSRVGRPTLAYVPAAVEPPLLHAATWLGGVRHDRRVAPTTVLEQLAFDGDLRRPCRELSFGNLRKLLLAEAFSSRANLIVIDEATEGLDSPGAAALLALMAETRSRGAGVLFTEQQTQTIVGADRVALLRQGRLTIEASDIAEITVSLRGPAANVGELTDRAAGLGFRYVTERR
jgi:ABC-type multidrug transport system ATPase subunit